MTRTDRVRIQPVERPEPDLDTVVLAILAMLDDPAAPLAQSAPGGAAEVAA